MSRERSISEIYGEGLDSGGRPTPVYRALRTLFCSACGTPMGAGSLFTRKSIPHFALRILPRCQRCAPFEVVAEQQEQEQEQQPPSQTPSQPDEPRSSLLNSLLSPPDGPEEAPEERRREVEEEVERRLGPALSRSRQKRP